MGEDSSTSAGAESSESNAVVQAEITPSEFGRNFTKSKKLADDFSEAGKGEKDLSGKSKKAKPIGTPSPSDEEKTAKASPKTPASVEEKPLEAAKVPETPKEEPRKIKVKVNGVEREVTEDVLVRDYQIRQASDEKFRQAAELDKRNRSFAEKLQSPQGLMEVIQAFGHDPRKLAEEYLADVLNFEMLSPEQKRIKQLEMENAGYQNEQKQKAAQIEHEQMERVLRQDADSLQKEIISSIDGTDLPKDASTMRAIARHMTVAIRAQEHLPPELRRQVSPKDVLDDVKEEIRGYTGSITAKMTPEQIVNYLGQEKLNEIRQWELSKLKNPVSQSKESVKQPENRQNQKRHYKTMDEWKENQRRAGIRR